MAREGNPVKIEMHKVDGGWEIRKIAADKSVTVWACEDAQAALFKMASLMDGDEEKQVKGRSILIGTFIQDEKPGKKKDVKKVVEEHVKKDGLVPKPVQIPAGTGTIIPPGMAPYISGPYVVPAGQDGGYLQIGPTVVPAGWQPNWSMPSITISGAGNSLPTVGNTASWSKAVTANGLVPDQNLVTGTLFVGTGSVSSAQWVPANVNASLT